MELINKAAVKAEIENLVNTYKKCPTRNSYEEGLKDGRLIGYKDALHKISILEVKEVEEPSKDLEEAEKFYVSTHTEFFDSEGKPHVAPAFIAGAKWQEEQIMKNVIEREVKEDAGGYPYIDATELYDYDNDKPLAKSGDKVKVVFIKDK